jgi:polyisoprenoid-binding protein YceI
MPLRYAIAPEWAVLAWSLPYGWYQPPPPPERSWLPPPGRYRVDPERSTVSGSVRSGWRRTRGGGGVTGALRFGRDAADIAVELAVQAAGLHTGDPARDRTLHALLDAPSHPLVRFTAGELEAAHGGWVLHGLVTGGGAAAPLPLWIDMVSGPDGAVALWVRGTLEPGASGLRRRVAVELEIVAVPEATAPPYVRGDLSTGAAAPAASAP